MIEGQSIEARARDALKHSIILGELQPNSLDSFSKIGRRVNLDAGSTLFHQGDPGDAVYVIESGSVEISILSESGKKLSLNLMGPFDVFGEIAALDGGARTATATTLEPTTLLQYSRLDLQNVMLQHPQIAIDFIAVLCRRLRWVSQQVEDLALLDVESRLARRLLILHAKFSDESGLIHLSQSELADFLAVSRESINKVLQTWRAEGLIELSRGAVRVCDQTGLAEIANTN